MLSLASSLVSSALGLANILKNGVARVLGHGGACDGMCAGQFVLVFFACLTPTQLWLNFILLIFSEGNSTKIEPCNEQACEVIEEVGLRQNTEADNLDIEEFEDYYAYDTNQEYEDYNNEIDCSIYGQAQIIFKDLEKKKCSEYKADGFRCVPFYSCKGGEIITDGRDILGVRGAIFNPLDSCTTSSTFSRMYWKT